MEKRTRIVEVGGQNIELEERLCSGGCGKKFWVQSKSAHKTARTNCAEICNNLFMSFSQSRSSKADKKKGIDLDDKRLKMKQIWKDNVFKVKELAKTERYWEKDRMKIAQYALEVTYCKYDEKERRKILRGFNLNNFALAAGLDPRTLSLWVAVKRHVLNKLPDLSFYEESMYKIAKKTYNQITRDTPAKKVEKIFFQELKKLKQ